MVDGWLVGWLVVGGWWLMYGNNRGDGDGDGDGDENGDGMVLNRWIGGK